MKAIAPALRGDDALGFLAALGVISLAEVGELPDTRLSWHGVRSPVAVFERDDEGFDLKVLGDELTASFDRIRASGSVAPGLPPHFPLEVGGSSTDPMRMTRDELKCYFEEAEEARQEGNPWYGGWLVALCGQASSKDPKRGDVELTPFYAPTGRMAMRTSIFDKTAEAVEAVAGPADALTGWVRTGYAGANFDDRAIRDGGTTTSGDPDNQGAPSPTWLAVMAIRFFPMMDDGHRVQTVGWQRVKLYEGFTWRSLIWPIWRRPLDGPAIRTLLAHPAMLIERASTDPRIGQPGALRALGVQAVFGSSRRTLSQGDGPLGPARCVWADAGQQPGE